MLPPVHEQSSTGQYRYRPNSASASPGETYISLVSLSSRLFEENACVFVKHVLLEGCWRLDEARGLELFVGRHFF